MHMCAPEVVKTTASSSTAPSPEKAAPSRLTWLESGLKSGSGSRIMVRVVVRVVVRHMVRVVVRVMERVRLSVRVSTGAVVRTRRREAVRVERSECAPRSTPQRSGCGWDWGYGEGQDKAVVSSGQRTASTTECVAAREAGERHVSSVGDTKVACRSEGGRCQRRDTQEGETSVPKESPGDAWAHPCTESELC